MTQPLTSNQVYCDSDFYALLKAVNQTLTEDRNAYTRDFIGKNLLYKGIHMLLINHMTSFFNRFSCWSSTCILADCSTFCRHSTRNKFQVSRHQTFYTQQAFIG